MSAVNKTVVRIAGKDYYIKSTEEDEYIQRIALYLDKKLSKILRDGSKLSTSMAAVLAALNVADDLFKTREHAVTIENEWNEYKEKLSVLENDKNRLQIERDALVNDLNALKIELAKRETEIKELRNNDRKSYQRPQEGNKRSN